MSLCLNSLQNHHFDGSNDMELRASMQKAIIPYREKFGFEGNVMLFAMTLSKMWPVGLTEITVDKFNSIGEKENMYFHIY